MSAAATAEWDAPDLDLWTYHNAVDHNAVTASTFGGGFEITSDRNRASTSTGDVITAAGNRRFVPGFQTKV